MKKIFVLFLLFISITPTYANAIPKGCYINQLSFLDLTILGLVQFLFMFIIQKIAYNGREIGHTRDNVASFFGIVVCAAILSFGLAVILHSLLLSYVTLVLCIIIFSMILIVFFEDEMSFDKILFTIFNCVGLIMASVTVFEMHFQLLIASIVGIIIGLCSYYFWQWLDNKKILNFKITIMKKKIKIPECPEWMKFLAFLAFCFSGLFFVALIFGCIYDPIKEAIEEKKFQEWYCKKFHKKYHKVWSYWYNNTLGYECEKCGVKFDTDEKWIEVRIAQS